MIMTYRSSDEEPCLCFCGQSDLENNKGAWKMSFLEYFLLHSLAETIQLNMDFAAW